MADRDLDSFFRRLRQQAATRSKKAELTAAYAAGRSTAARNALIEANLSLVVSMAKQFSAVAELGDLIQEGSMGLMEAAERFDARRGVAFSTFAWPWVRKYIYAAVRASGSTRISEHAKRLLQAEDQAHAALAQTLGREPTHGELDDALGRSSAVAATTQAARLLRRRGDEADLAGIATDLDLDADLDLQEQVHAFRRTLDEVAPAGSRARAVFLAHAIEEQPLAEVARSVGVTRERAGQIYRSVLAQIHRALGAPQQPAQEAPQRDMWGA